MDWPWHVKVTYTDGTARENDFTDDFDPVKYAEHVSSRPNVVRVDVSVSFVDGQAVSPQAATEAQPAPRVSDRRRCGPCNQGDCGGCRLTKCQCECQGSLRSARA